MLADIIVRAKGNAPLTAACIKSIRENTPPCDARIILVDDGSMPPLHKVLEDTGDIYVRCEESAGAVSATNRGLAISLGLSDTAYVAVMDNDTRVPDGDMGWLDRFVAELGEFPGTGAVGASTNYANPPQHILSVPNTYTADWSDADGKRGGVRANPPIALLVSFACLIRKDAVKAIGFWDERYNPGNYEDSDFAIALRAGGYEVRVARSVYIHHAGHKTFGPQLQRLLHENERKFVEKWGIGTLYDMGVIAPEIMAKIAQGRVPQ